MSSVQTTTCYHHCQCEGCGSVFTALGEPHSTEAQQLCEACDLEYRSWLSDLAARDEENERGAA